MLLGRGLSLLGATGAATVTASAYDLVSCERRLRAVPTPTPRTRRALSHSHVRLPTHPPTHRTAGEPPPLRLDGLGGRGRRRGGRSLGGRAHDRGQDGGQRGHHQEAAGDAERDGAG